MHALKRKIASRKVLEGLLLGSIVLLPVCRLTGRHLVEPPVKLARGSLFRAERLRIPSIASILLCSEMARL